ncbi:MAG: polysaccharide biosynthesis/export family protein [Chitinophagaceae bacterium]
MKLHPVTFVACISLFFFTSCVSTKSSTYFNGLSNSEIVYQVQSLEPVIQKNDLLSINVNSLSPEASQQFNLYSISSSTGPVNSGTITQTSGFLVDQDGNIQFPILGTVQAAGLTKKQLKESITRSIVQKNLLFEPVVNIRYLNYRVTVLGEVAHPTVINVPGEKISLLEAIGLAGDLTNYAERGNVLIIREEQEGKRITQRVNLNDTAILSSPNYFLRSNDVIYVASNKSKVASTSTAKQWLPAVLASMSFIAVVTQALTR